MRIPKKSKKGKKWNKDRQTSIRANVIAREILEMKKFHQMKLAINQEDLFLHLFITPTYH